MTIKCGERIALLREKKRLTQEDLSHKLGITRASLSHYEKNRRQPDFETLNKIADFFHVTIDYLLSRTDHPNTMLDTNVRKFVDNLELSETDILGQFALTVDGKKLTQEEAARFIAFVRAERSMK